VRYPLSGPARAALLARPGWARLT